MTDVENRGREERLGSGDKKQISNEEGSFEETIRIEDVKKAVNNHLKSGMSPGINVIDQTLLNILNNKESRYCI